MLDLATNPKSEMPIPLLGDIIFKGFDSIPYGYTIVRTTAWLLLLAGLKYFFGGARNRAERLMHSKVVLITVCIGSKLVEAVGSSLTSFF